MIKRVVAWVLFLLVLWAGWHYASRFKSPLAMPINPVLNSLPVSGSGCGENCK